MRLREAFVSKMAAAAFVMSAAPSAPALAQELLPEPANATAQSATQTTLPNNPETKNTLAPTTTLQPKNTPAAAAGESSIAHALSINPIIPVGVIAGLGGAYALVLLMAGGRRRRIDGLHAALGGLMVVTLLNPEFVEEERAMLPTEVALVVDKSESQTLGNRGRATGEMKAEIVRKLSAMPGVNVRVVEVDGNDDGTNLIGAIREATADIAPDRLGAVIALTDGQVHDVNGAENLLADGVPLHALISGQESEHDRRIVLEGAPVFGLLGKSQEISFRVVDDGTSEKTGGRIPVTITSEGRVLARIMAVPGEIVKTTVDIQHVGANLIELKAAPLEGELTLVNNRVVASIQGIRESLSVLLVSGSPDSGIRVMRDLLKSDPGTDLVHFTIRRTPEKIDTTPSRELALVPLPTHELFTARLGKFDVVIFDRYEYNGLIPTPYFNNVAQYVKDGGAVFVVSGSEYTRPGSLYNTPMKSVLPVAPRGTGTDAPYVPRVSETGERHPVTRGLLDEGNPADWGRWLRIIESAGLASGHVVMEGDGEKPLLILKRVEKGRIAMLQSDSAPGWARGFDGGGPYAGLITQTLQWLIKNPALEEEALRLRSEKGELVVEQQTMDDNAKPVVIETPSGKALNVLPEKAGPGIWRATIPAGEQGVYSAGLKGQNAPQAFINVGSANPKEYAGAFSTTEIMRPLVERTGGMIARATDSSGRVSVPKLSARMNGESMAGADWMGIRRTEASERTGIEYMKLLPWWLSLTLGIGLAGGFYWYESGRGAKKKSSPRNDGPGIT